MAGEKACKAFLRKERKKEGNTESTGTDLILFGNIIAQWRNGVDIYIRNAGWFSKNTKHRLNKLGARLQQVKGEWFLNDIPWDGSFCKLEQTSKTEQLKSALFI